MRPACTDCRPSGWRAAPSVSGSQPRRQFRRNWKQPREWFSPADLARRHSAPRQPWHGRRSIKHPAPPRSFQIRFCRRRRRRAAATTLRTQSRDTARRVVGSRVSVASLRQSSSGIVSWVARGYSSLPNTVERNAIPHIRAILRALSIHSCDVQLGTPTLEAEQISSRQSVT